MRYRPSSYKGLQRRRPHQLPKLGGSKKDIRLGVVVLGFVLLFACSLFVFRGAEKKDKPTVSSAAATTSDQTASVLFPTSLSNPDATLIGLSSQKPVGAITRTLSDNVFHVSVHATLPGIDRVSQFYEVWLVRPVPYDFVSAGEMITNDLGTFTLDWNGLSDKDYSGYTNVVITLQARGGDADPQTHIVEGEFGK